MGRALSVRGTRSSRPPGYTATLVPKALSQGVGCGFEIMKVDRPRRRYYQISPGGGEALAAGMERLRSEQGLLKGTPSPASGT